MRLRVLIFLLFSVSAFISKAQSWRLGIQGGPSISKINAESVENEDSRRGYHIGVFVDRFVSKKLSLGAQLQYSAQGAINKRLFNQNPDRPVTWEYNINYLNLPISLAYHPHQMIKAYGGFYTGFLVGLSTSREADFSNTLDEPNKDNLNSQDFGYHLGFEVNYHPISIGIRHFQGFSDLPDSRAADILINNAKNTFTQFYLSYTIYKKGLP